MKTTEPRPQRAEPLVRVAADTFDLVPGAPQLLSLYRERSVSRDAALAAFRAGELSWQIVYTRPSLTSVRAAALAITPLPASAVIACASSVPKVVPRGFPPRVRDLREGSAR
jgi:hypothetical protein